jgi:hypothetical protein
MNILLFMVTGSTRRWGCFDRFWLWCRFWFWRRRRWRRVCSFMNSSHLPLCGSSAILVLTEIIVILNWWYPVLDAVSVRSKEKSIGLQSLLGQICTRDVWGVIGRLNCYVGLVGHSTTKKSLIMYSMISNCKMCTRNICDLVKMHCTYYEMVGIECIMVFNQWVIVIYITYMYTMDYSRLDLKIYISEQYVC